MHNDVVADWHALLASDDLSRLDTMLADDTVFHSPVLHTAQHGKALVTMYLSAAAQVLLSSGFHYVREVVGPSDAVLEFECEIGGVHINGIDMFHWNADGKIDDFKVMIRPLKAVNLLHGMMVEVFSQMGPKA